MSYIGQAPGLGQRSVFRFVSLAGQSLFSGRDAQGLTLGYAPGVSTIVALNGRVLSAPDYAATDGSTIALAKSLTAGDEVVILSDAPFSVADTYGRAEALTAFTHKRNRIVNPGMRIAQEYGTTAVQVSTATQYVADQIYGYRAGTTGAVEVQRVALKTPGGSDWRLRATVTTANGSPAGTDSMSLGTKIEGFEISDLLWGTPNAKGITLRFGVRSSVAGTFPVSIRNAGVTRAWVGTYTISPGEVGVDVLRTVYVPGDVSGTWQVDNQIGMQIDFSFNVGASYQGVAGWQGSNVLAVAGATNLMATLNATIHLFDLGLYEGQALPNFILPPIDEDLRKCQRYWFADGGVIFRAIATASYGGAVIVIPTRVPMRTVPTVTITATPSSILGAQSNTATPASMLSAANTQNQLSFWFASNGGAADWISFNYSTNARL